MTNPNNDENVPDLVPATEEFRNWFAQAIVAARKVNGELARQILDQAKQDNTYPIKEQEAIVAPQAVEEQSESLSLDDTLYKMLRDPSVLFELSSNYNPITKSWAPWLDSYIWDLTGNERVPKSTDRKYDARSTSQLHGGDRERCSFAYTRDGDQLIHQVCFNDDRFDSRRNMSAFYVTAPENSEYSKILSNSHNIMRVFAILCRDFFEAQPLPKGWSKHAPGQDLYTAICLWVARKCRLYEV